MKIGVAAVKGTFQGTVRLRDKQPPDSYRLNVDGTSVADHVAEFLQTRTQTDPCALGKAAYVSTPPPLASSVVVKQPGETVRRHGLALVQAGLATKRGRGLVLSRTALHSPRMTLLLLNPANPYHWVSIKCTVTREVSEDDAREGARVTAQLDRIWTKYTKQPPPYGLRGPSRNERRVLFECAVDRVATFGKP